MAAATASVVALGARSVVHSPPKHSRAVAAATVQTQSFTASSARTSKQCRQRHTFCQAVAMTEAPPAADAVSAAPLPELPPLDGACFRRASCARYVPPAIKHTNHRPCFSPRWASHPAAGYEAACAFADFANWLIPGRVMLGRYPFVEPSRCRSRDVGEEQLRRLLVAGVTTFVCLQVCGACRLAPGQPALSS